VLITFLSDFGLEDDFVGTCHGVMKIIAPEVEILDITHGIQRHGVLQGALVLANTLPYFPTGVHLAVVDPGVGSGRRSLALRSGDGRLFVGPDNGLLVPAAEKLGGIEAAHEITNPAYLLDRVSATFHGRDIFSPAALRLLYRYSGGVPRLINIAAHRALLAGYTREQRTIGPTVIGIRGPIRWPRAPPREASNSMQMVMGRVAMPACKARSSRTTRRTSSSGRTISAT